MQLAFRICLVNTFVSVLEKKILINWREVNVRRHAKSYQLSAEGCCSSCPGHLVVESVIS